MSQTLNVQGPQTIISKKFSVKHSFRAGAVIWVKDRKSGGDYYVVLKSHSRPAKGIQLPGGRVEKLENAADAVVREVKEETGLDTRILCPLGLIYINNPAKNYSRLETYYIVRPTKPLDINKRWRHIDKDRSKQRMEIWSVPINFDTRYLTPGQDLAVDMFVSWLAEHSKPVNSNLPKIIGGEQAQSIEAKMIIGGEFKSIIQSNFTNPEFGSENNADQNNNTGNNNPGRRRYYPKNNGVNKPYFNRKKGPNQYPYKKKYDENR